MADFCEQYYTSPGPNYSAPDHNSYGATKGMSYEYPAYQSPWRARNSPNWASAAEHGLTLDGRSMLPPLQSRLYSSTWGGRGFYDQYSSAHVPINKGTAFSNTARALAAMSEQPVVEPSEYDFRKRYVRIRNVLHAGKRSGGGYGARRYFASR
mmetsp:Transcript_17317/g.19378  ORF Transcript_17317/g.19378 Transcript_17317/m.19378 type:complete len:153 (+) Transcript_17317:27-485(+)|eukprot:CAMPEP_0205819188 /NCGR_PEP_ID=MMETSP0206-20130828/1452_1 /ASSEMBLY_ACC=CAM_ASM_000279 /TAXON_ID=36767 /ORGANISM="Euplotes focardii, Strain TN1" /LENGTH=152 /DNA_ID=CAMNT_0053112465 /DNA_START=26 /DNA_END=484 /DNA_ORIENTATION=-